MNNLIARMLLFSQSCAIWDHILYYLSVLSGIPFPPSAVFFPVHPSLGLPPPPVLLRQWFRVRRCFFYVLLFLNHLPHHTTIVRWHGLSSEIFSFVFLRVFFFFLSHAAICHSRPSVSPSSVPVLPPPSPFSLALSLYIRPLLVVSGFRTSGDWLPLLPWPQRPLPSRRRLCLFLLPLCTLTQSSLCGGEGEGDRATTGPLREAFITITSAELYQHKYTEMHQAHVNTYRQTHRIHRTHPPHKFIYREGRAMIELWLLKLRVSERGSTRKRLKGRVLLGPCLSQCTVQLGHDGALMRGLQVSVI